MINDFGPSSNSRRHGLAWDEEANSPIAPE
jgi:hypothetical protein